MIRDYEPSIVVFGGCGYIGSHLVRQLLALGYKVRAFDNFTFGRAGLEGLDSPNLQIISGDISNAKEVSYAIRGCEAVILLAAIIGHRRREINRLYLREVNLIASSMVLDAAKEHGINRFIFASSDSVYGEQHGVMYETSTPDPISIFARLKLRMEERVLKSQSSDFCPTVLRICNCHGYSPRMRFDLLPNGMVRDAILTKQLCVEGGEQWRAFINVEDAARVFVTVLEAYPDTVNGEIFNVGDSAQNLQFNQLINLVSSIVPNCSIRFIEAKPDLPDYRVSFSKLEKSLNFSPKISITESLQNLAHRLEKGEIPNPYSSIYHNTL